MIDKKTTTQHSDRWKIIVVIKNMKETWNLRLTLHRTVTDV